MGINLFAERELYEQQLSESRRFRRSCYIIVMLLMDDACRIFRDWDSVKQRHGFDIDSMLLSSEENFFEEHYNNLLDIFPRAKNVLDRSKFSEE